MGNRILICDDDVHILRAAEFKLQRAGFDVVCASDGEEAWAAIKACGPEMVVTDCQMPRLDGLGLVERIRQHEQTRGLPVVMLTAKGFELEHDELAQNLDILAVLSKPFSPRELLKCVEQVLATGTYEKTNHLMSV